MTALSILAAIIAAPLCMAAAVAVVGLLFGDWIRRLP